MDRAPLRPVPGPPSAPVSDAEAARLVASFLPFAGERERLALALVVLAGRSREEVGGRLGLDSEQVAVTLATARKELRRTLSRLPGSGWCERAERLISDRLDGALEESITRRLDVHLRNCPRCVEHERRLVQATDALVGGAAPPPGADVRGLAVAAEPEAQPAASERESERVAQAEPPPSEPEAKRAAEAEPAPAGAGRPEPAAPGRRTLEDSAPAPASRPVRARLSTLSWHLLFAFAVLLAVGSLALAVAGLLGAGL